MSEVSISLFAGTDIGMRRAANEDSFLIADLDAGSSEESVEVISHELGARGYLMVVSDGMGGAAAGEVASEFAVKTLLETLTQSSNARAIEEELKQAAEAANERIWNHAQDNPSLLGMGATLTAVIAQPDAVHIAQVGDSRAYLIRGEKIAQLTKDQSLAQALVDAGIIEPEQAHLVPQNVIMQALGTQPNLDVKMSRLPICRNDALLICSDGLSNKIEAPEMMQVLKEAGDLKAAAKRLIEIANERGGEDNITVIVARFDGAGLSDTSEEGYSVENFNGFGMMSYEDAAFIASKFIPGKPAPAAPAAPAADVQTESGEAGEGEPYPAAITGVLRLPDNFPAAAATASATASKNAGADEGATTAAEERLYAEALEQRESFEREQAAKERKSLMVMWVIAAVSLIALLVIAYLWLKPRLQPQPEPPPAIEQPETGTGEHRQPLPQQNAPPVS